MYAVFSGARMGHENYPLFKRHSWNYDFDGSVLYIADPTLSAWPDLLLAWYLGAREFDLYPFLAGIIARLAKALGANQIITYGSSGGGFAALKMAKYLRADAIAINPQIYIRNYSYFPVFAAMTGFESWQNAARRTDLEFTEDSSCLIVQNDTDLPHCQHHLYPLLQSRGIRPKYGLAGAGNLHSWIYHRPGGHDSQEDQNILPFILYFAEKLKSADLAELAPLDNLAIAVSEMWALKGEPDFGTRAKAAALRPAKDSIANEKKTG